jgi:YbbR domain-containing protein
MNRIGLKLACLVTSIVIWIQVASTTTTEATLQLPLEIANLPEGTTVAGSEIPASVGVRVRGSKLRLLAHAVFNREAGRVVLDLDGFEPGALILHDVGPEDVQTDLEAEAIQPPQRLRVRLDRLESRGVPVVVPTLGRIRENRQLLRPVAAVPDSITVTGPARVVDGIDTVRTDPVDLARLEPTSVLERTLTAPSPYVTLEPDRVRVDAPVVKTESRTLPNVPVVALVDAGQAEVGISPPVADLMVRGPADSIATLVAARVSVTVPVGDLGEGIHSLRAEVAVPDWLTVLAVEPETFTVIVGSPAPEGAVGGAREDGAPGDGTTDEGRPGDGRPGDGRPGDGTPDDQTPEGGSR